MSNFTEARYEQPTPKYLNAERAKFQQTFGLFATHIIKAPVTDFKFDHDLIDDVSMRVHQRLNYYLFFHNIRLAQSRQAGLKAYWILRYRPITPYSPTLWNEEYDVNVYFAFFVLFCEAMGECLVKIPSNIRTIIVNNVLIEYQNIFMRAFNEYDISKEAMMLVSESIKSIFVGEIKSIIK
jgi:hypothetical protein